ncbi:MAG TPA: serine protease [Bacteroidales bacterium]|nr:serine protease [Bacteroidales bacterium]
MARIVFLFAFLILLVAGSCSHSRLPGRIPAGTSGRYEGDFTGMAAQPVDRVVPAVKKVYCVATYSTWQFRRDDRVTAYHLQKGFYRKMAWGVITTSETISGTGTVLQQNRDRIAVLTCAHVVTSPDTLISYYEPEGDDPIRYIQRFSLREKQEIWVADLTGCGPFAAVASDPALDIALLGAHCVSAAVTVSPFPCAAGRAAALEWGTRLFILGYPMGHLVLTRGLASPSGRKGGAFFVDALLNKGYSGGILLATRSDGKGLELVGMVTSVNSTREEYLRPQPDHPSTPDWMAYKGELFIGQSERIQYGLNTVIPVESIFNFMLDHRQDFLNEGFLPDQFFHQDP